MVPAGIVVRESLPQTLTGKLDRRALPPPGTEDLEPAPGPMAPRDDVERTLVALWETALGVGPLGVDDNFFDIGGHSLLAVEVFAAIERRFGRRLPLATLFRAPTVEALASLLRERPVAAPTPSLVAIQPGGSLPPLFCVPGHFGTVLSFQGLARHLGTDQPVYGLEARGLDGASVPHATIPEMAADYIAEIRARWPEGPYHLAGYCLGAKVAFEMAQQLRAQGKEVGLLALLDSYGPAAPHAGRHRPRLHRLLGRAVRRFHVERENLVLLTPRERLDYLLTGLGRLRSRLARRLTRTLEVRTGTRARDDFRRVAAAHRGAARAYRPRVYPGPILLLRGRHWLTRHFVDPEFGWGGLAAGGLTVRLIEGPPGSILQEPRVRALAEALRAQLRDRRVSSDSRASVPARVQAPEVIGSA
jgi:thioesterase domain-containing protein/acyl carrier protein